MRFREDHQEDLDRARREVAEWWQRNPQGTADQLVVDLIGQFHHDYGPVLRSVLFALERHEARTATGISVIAGEDR